MLRRLALIAFALTALAHLAAIAADLTWLDWVTKAAAMPLLAAWVWLRGGPRLVVLALLLSAAGDVALRFDAGIGVFILGMVFFAAAHAGYVSFFVRAGALAVLRQRWAVPVVYGVVWLALLAVLWSGLGALRLPVAGYSLLLTATAVTSAGFAARAGVGGALFLISDSLIAFGLADLPRPAAPDFWVMSTYFVAQFLLASSASTPRRAASIGSGADPSRPPGQRRGSASDLAGADRAGLENAAS